MPSRPSKLEYASPTPTAPSSSTRRRVVTAAVCFVVSWLVWLGIAIATFDAFDDELFGWLLFLVGVAGTASGIVMFVIVHVIVELASNH